MDLVVINYKAGNIQSVLFALQRLGMEGTLSDDPERILKADKIIFPGVGEASSAMNALREKGLDKLIPKLRQPLLGICLGMQLLCEHSEEGNTDCLGVFPVKVKRFDNSKTPDVKVPHVGWNTINTLKGPLYQGFRQEEYMYYVHSYYAELSTCTTAETTYIHPYSASLGRDNFHAAQFHPEKSGKAGELLLSNFLAL